VQVLRLIQFKLTHQREFANLVSFFTDHFGGVRDLHDSTRSSSAGFNSFSNATDISSSQTLMAQMSSQTAGGSVVGGGGGGSGGGGAGAGMMSPPKWIPKEKVPRTVSRMFIERESVVQTEERGVQVESEKEEEKFELTERVMLELINDDSFMKEVFVHSPSGLAFGRGMRD